MPGLAVVDDASRRRRPGGARRRRPRRGPARRGRRRRPPRGRGAGAPPCSSGGRGRLPVCVVRMCSVERFTPLSSWRGVGLAFNAPAQPGASRPERPLRTASRRGAAHLHDAQAPARHGMQPVRAAAHRRAARARRSERVVALVDDRRRSTAGRGARSRSRRSRARPRSPGPAPTTPVPAASRPRPPGSTAGRNDGIASPAKPMQPAPGSRRDERPQPEAVLVPVADEPVEQFGALGRRQRPVRRHPAHDRRVGVQRDERVEVLGRPPRAQEQPLGLDARMDHRVNKGDAVPSHLRYRPPGRSAKGAPGSRWRASQPLGLALCGSVPRLGRTYSGAFGEVKDARRKNSANCGDSLRSRASTRNVPVMSVIDVQDVAWDLDPLVDGEGPEGADRMLAEADERAARVRRALRRPRGRRSTARSSPRRWPSSQAIAELVGRAGQLRAPALLRRHDRPGERRARRARQREGDGGRDEAPVLRPRVGGARRRARRGAARRRRPRHEPPPPAHGPPLPAAPPHRAGGEDHDREGGQRPRGVVAPVLRADERDHGRHVPATRSRSSSTSRSAACCRPTASVRRTTAEAVTAALEPDLRTRAYIYNTIAQDKATDDRLRGYPSWISSRNLSNEASDESVQALVEAVRANYDLPQRWYRLKAQPAGPRPARRLRPLGLDRDGGGQDRVARGDRDRARRRSTTSRRRCTTRPSASSTSTGSTRRCGPASAAARSAPTRSRASTRT